MSVSCSPVDESPQLRVDTTFPSPGTARAAIVGEIDIATTGVLRDSLLTVLRDRSSVDLNVDLSGVTFLDCSGLGTLVAVHHAAARTRSRMRVTGSRPIVHRMLDLTGLLDVLTAPSGWPPRSIADTTGPPRITLRRSPGPQRPRRPVAA